MWVLFGKAPLRTNSCSSDRGLGINMLPGILLMKKPGRKKVAGMPVERMYFSTSAFESKCSTPENFPLVTDMLRQ